MASNNNLRAHMKQCFSAPSLRAYVAEFGCSTPTGTPDASALVATAVAQALGLYAAVFIAADVSGGHVNPAVTFAFAIGGHIPVPNAIFYWAAQMLGSTFACLVLNCLSAGQARTITVASVSSLPPHAMSNFPSFFAVPITRIATLMTGFGASILEGIMTFVLVYAVHVAGGRRLAAAATAPVAGMVTGACVLAAGSMTGASLNPARSFGAAVVSGQYQNQAVYWVGPMIGGAVAALLHQCVMFSAVPEPPPPQQQQHHGSVETVVV
ncbi:hypothetical protein EJB05_38464, partial [Eragrostis curvula]